MAEMFGGPVGSRLAEADEQLFVKRNLDAVKELGEIAMQPDRRALLQQQGRMADAHATLFSTQAQAAQFKLDAEKQLAAAVQSGAMGLEGKDGDEQAFELMRIAAGAGNLEAARKMLLTGAQAANQRASAERAMEQAAKAKVETEKLDLALLEGMVRNSRDQASFDRNNMMYQQMTGRPSPFAGQQFSPQVVKNLTESTIAAKDRLMASLRAAEEAGRNKRHGDTVRHQEAVEEYNRERIRVQDERTRVLEKAGGRGTGSPSVQDRDATRRVIRREVEDLASEDVELAVDSVASRAKEIMRGNRALGREAAIFRAFNEAKEAGDFESVRQGVEVPFVGRVGSKTRFTGMGKQPRAALPLPTGTDVGAIMEQMKSGRYYVTPKGVAKYLGHGRFADPVDLEEEED